MAAAKELAANGGQGKTKRLEELKRLAPSEGEAKFSPADVGLPFPNWRQSQDVAILSCFGPGAEVLILESPTGYGKTAIAIACSVLAKKKGGGPSHALVPTKAQQLFYTSQCKEVTALFGRQNYHCVLCPSRTAANCFEEQFSDEPSRCEAADRCEYVRARTQAEESALTVLNYSLALSAPWPQHRPAPFVFLDDAHHLIEAGPSWLGCTLSPQLQRDFDLPPFPYINPSDPNAAKRACTYLQRCDRAISSLVAKKRLVTAEYLRRKIRRTLKLMEADPSIWYICSHKGGFTAKPLSARLLLPLLLKENPPLKAVLMSAAIGEISLFAEELGLEKGTYDFFETPHFLPPEKRKVYVLDVPPIGWKSTEKDYQRQAEAIASVLKEFPDWPGLILVASKKHALDLARRLARYGLHERIFVPPGTDGQHVPTDGQVQKWLKFLKGKPNGVCVSWTFWEIPCGEVRICIVAKVPFSNLKDPYERARKDFNPPLYLQRAAARLVNGLGRIRREHSSDGIAVIADQNLEKVRKFLPFSLQECLEKASFV